MSGMDFEVKDDDVGVRLLVALPFGLGERDRLDEVALGVLVNLDGLREAEVDEGRGIAQVQILQGLGLSSRKSF